MINVGISDRHTSTTSKVSNFGQLITGPLDFSEFYTALASVNDASVNIITPQAHKIFVITAIIFSALRDVGANGTVVTLYRSSDGPATGTQTKVLYVDDIIKQGRVVIPDLNVKVPKGNWVNFECDDASVRCNISGYYTSDVE